MLGRAGAWFVGQTHLGHLLVKLGAALSMETHTQYMLVGGKLALAPFPCPFRRADGKSQGERWGAFRCLCPHTTDDLVSFPVWQVTVTAGALLWDRDSFPTARDGLPAAGPQHPALEGVIQRC